ncbi:hypothetical protein [Ponticaulis sp.]|uniref:hypothetical protein n=1 Tax=Ponticaulis sp. TaxID=2020902 RepID=UPI000C5B7B79|nr:hypothetical protein [Ponticaulis sp.]MBN02797.1 hypothetical protein [Ponticaulis sp.]|tara:strand:- start:70 stop:438 length:369 start_codon:yes stop_codon:yes gene_type:complete
MLKTGFAFMTALASLAACAHPVSGAPVPAILASEAELTPLMAELREMTGRANVELGADDPLATPVVTILPPPAGPFEGNNPALPTSYGLELRDGACVLVDQDGTMVRTLQGVTCAPYASKAG